MNSEYIFKYICLNAYSATPLYLQLANSILKALANRKIQKHDKLPSINDLSDNLEISRATCEKAYKHLKHLGFVASNPGRGYFIAKSNDAEMPKVFLLFNKLSASKKIIYDSFVATLGEQALVDFYIYNNDYSLFKKLLLNKQGKYSHYVIIPHFLEGGDNAHELLNDCVGGELILLDKKISGIKCDYGAVYQNFEKDIYSALGEAIKSLQKYHTIKLVFPRNSYYPEEIKKGLFKFCQDYAFNNKIVFNVENEKIESGDLFISVMEDDLVILIEKIIFEDLIPGKDVGIISYNETPLKKLILNGITTVSADFKKMGEYAAKLVLLKSKEHFEVPFHINMRLSI